RRNSRWLSNSSTTNSKLLGHESSVFHRSLIVVGSLAGDLWQFHRLFVNLLVRNQAQQVRDTVEARSLFIVGAHDVPWRCIGVGRGHHHVAGARVVIPTAARG